MAIIEVKTEITGVILSILKNTGDSVDEDEPIMTLESMKMEIPVAAPESGKIVEIKVAEEETVTEGSVVATIDV
ncbi:MAG: acetyl-CoA carboxylase biotin carboxyl carrier protein subunit [Methyloligellaceae bacterium]